MMEDFIESAKIPDRIIGTTEAAEYLGISPSKVCEEIRAGNLPAEKDREVTKYHYAQLWSESE